MAASTANMCFRSDSLAVYSCMSASASSREGRVGIRKYYHTERGSAGGGRGWTGGRVDGGRVEAENSGVRFQASGVDAVFSVHPSTRSPFHRFMSHHLRSVE